ncbi:MAG: rhamnogalacturonan acetylesterase [Anaeroplasmataceae bacterium]|nr:rhamnogalacturonan acetylesterase [Anaeroplasmataceae bacterium]MDE5867444.1 rhamnogalacturonan acetylesterase [Anaeroplasmataceae bacterium]
MSRRLITLGDSTMQFNHFKKFPQTGWPQALVRFIKPNVEILNFAVNGKSTKNYISLGLFDKALSHVQQGDIVIIGFGHNDVKVEDETRFTEPYGSYQQNLKYMVEKCQAQKADVILLTSIIERHFEDGKLIDSPHLEYTKAAKKLAQELNIPCVDLYEATKQKISKEGEEASKRFYMNFGPNLYASHPDGLLDNTHLRYDGAFLVANCFYEEMKKQHLHEDIFLELEV